MATEIRFKFKHVDGQGNEQGFFSTKGSFNEEQLVLGDQTIPIDAIYHAVTRFKRLIIAVAGKSDEAAILVLAITSGPIAKLHSAVNQLASERQARRHQERLDHQGRAGEFRIEVCPHCSSVIDVSSLPDSPQVYCNFCDTVATLDDAARPADEGRFHHCSECGLFAQPKGFTVFYFYFLVVIYGWRYRQAHMCNTCMRREAWKMLGGNLLFLLGVPVAITQLVRAYAGGSMLSKAFAGLDKGNAQLKAKRYGRAVESYTAIEDRLGHAAGVRFNHGLALAANAQLVEAALQLERALADCSNYVPAVKVLAGCYDQLGRTEDLELLKAQWMDDGDPATAGNAESVAAT